MSEELHAHVYRPDVPTIVVTFELYELYFWFELYERKMK